MRTRTLFTTALIATVAVGSATPSLAAKKAPITGTFTAQATPDPTSDQAAANTGKCNPKTPTARFTHEFVVPAAGTLHVNVNNKLDWSADIREMDGSVDSDSDGTGPTDPEVMDASFKKKTKVIIGVCNNEGEPSITVSYTFTFK
jgi:hypothetical protein